jgi:hypothetical protein
MPVADVALSQTYLRGGSLSDDPCNDLSAENPIGIEGSSVSDRGTSFEFFSSAWQFLCS